MKKREYKIILGILIILIIGINYNYLDSFVIKQISNKEPIIVKRVIDGDTIVDINEIHYRLLGINTPEKGENLYNEAKSFLEKKSLNKTILIEKHGKNKYKRELVYLFEENSEKNINLEIVENGYANYYFPEGKDIYYDKFAKAWEKCISKNINLCENSKDKCSYCIELKEFGYEKDIILYNKCSFECNLTKWSIKDEGRKKYVFNNFVLGGYKEIKITSKDFREEYVWTKTGDTIFIRDNLGKLILWKSY